MCTGSSLALKAKLSLHEKLFADVNTCCSYGLSRGLAFYVLFVAIEPQKKCEELDCCMLKLTID